jgi:YebC/PmpR family DNA-binding regulatory protein
MGRKWNNIKMKKAAQDKLRSQNYTKVLREVTMAVKRSGSADPDSNFSLKLALQKAREYNVPKDNVDKAIKKGMGDGTENYSEVNYEGYGLDGVAIFVEAATDNPTRTIANIRNYFNKNGGSIGKEGCLQFVFERKAVFTFENKNYDIDELTLELIDVGAEDVELEDGYITVKGEVESFGDLYKKLESMKIKLNSSELERLPLNTKEVLVKENYDKVLKLVDALESDDDVQKVYHNMDYNEAFDQD